MVKWIWVVALVAAIGAPAAGSNSNQWGLTGSGTGTGLVAGDHVMIGAHSDIGGTNVRGHAEATGQLNGQGQRYNLGGELICLSVAGNKALAVWQLREPVVAPGFPEFDWEGVYVEDNGEPVGGQPVDRMVDFVLTEQGRDSFCTTSAADFAFAALAQPIGSGNFVVSDR